MRWSAFSSCEIHEDDARAGSSLPVRTAIALIVAMAAAVPARAQWMGQAPDRTLEGDRSEMQFVAGRNVTVRAHIANDLFAAGRTVTLDNATANNALVAGNSVALRGGSVGEMVTAANALDLAGTVRTNLIAAARQIRVAADGSVGGDARLTAESVDMNGKVGGTLGVAAQRVTIAGTVGGKVDLLAEQIVVGPRASIGGDLVYRSQNPPQIAAGAKIAGQVRRLPMPNGPGLLASILGVGLFLSAAWLVAALLVVAVVQLALPGLTSGSAQRLTSHPWQSLGIGVAIAIVGGAVAALLCVSIVGLPIGGALMVSLVLGWLLASVATAYGLGRLIGGWPRDGGTVSTASRVGWALLGAVLLAVIGAIPFVGGVLVALAVAAGLGAVSVELSRRLRPA